MMWPGMSIPSSRLSVRGRVSGSARGSEAENESAMELEVCREV